MADIVRINELIGNKEFEEAKILLDEALKEDAENVELLKLAGLTYVNLGQWSEACKYFESAVKYAPDDATSTFYLAKCYESTGDLVAAKNFYQKVVELRPEYADAYKSLCLILLKMKNNADLIEYANEAAILFPEDYIYDFVKGTVMMDLKQYDTALELLKSAFDKAPDRPEILNSIGTCYVALGDTDHAINAYESVLNNDPNNAMAYFNIGSVYQIKNLHKLAINYFERAVKLEGDDERFLAALAMSEVKAMDYGCALNHYKQLATLCPNKEIYI